LALDALERIESEGAYANLVVPQMLARSGLSDRDRRFATDLIYGTTRMRRACDHLLDPLMARPPVPRVRSALRLGAYQLAFADVPPHAAVSETVEVAPKSARGLVNAVLRRVSDAVAGGLEWPDAGTRLSVPQWIVARLTNDLGAERAVTALESMNEPPEVTTRDDGYVQDKGSQFVAEAVGTEPGERVLDACAAPGGKATAMAAAGAWVVAADVRPKRLGLIRDNVARLRAEAEAAIDTGKTTRTTTPFGGLGDAPFQPGAVGGVALALSELGEGLPEDDPDGDMVVVGAEAGHPPWRPGSFDRVLVDAPCSGLGTLRRRADLRWRIEPEAVERLAEIQAGLLVASADLVRPGGMLVYSVCTLTVAETMGVDEVLAAERPDLVPVARPGFPWEPWGRGSILLPQVAGTDGMSLFRYRKQ
jgi:16S rRNA (cytosine967-C5)-methyltransferase